MFRYVSLDSCIGLCITLHNRSNKMRQTVYICVCATGGRNCVIFVVSYLLVSEKNTYIADFITELGVIDGSPF